MKIAKVDASVHQKFAQKYQVKGYPTILLFPLGAKGSPVNYEGQRSAEDMANWLNSQKIGQEKR